MIDRSKLEEFLISFRQEMHRFPELSNQEFNTTEKIKNVLEQNGIDCLDTGLKTGLCAKIKGAHPGKNNSFTCGY